MSVRIYFFFSFFLFFFFSFVLFFFFLFFFFSFLFFLEREKEWEGVGHFGTDQCIIVITSRGAGEGWEGRRF